MLPLKKNQSPDDKGNDIEGVLNWMRSKKIPTASSLDDDKFDKLPSVAVAKRSPEDRQKDVDDIAVWIRNGRRNDDDSPTNEFATIDQMFPLKKNQSPDDRAKDVEGVLNWMRSKKIPTASSLDDDKFDKLPSVAVSQRSPEDRQKDVDDIAVWIRNGRRNDDDSPTNEF